MSNPANTGTSATPARRGPDPIRAYQVHQRISRIILEELGSLEMWSPKLVNLQDLQRVNDAVQGELVKMVVEVANANPSDSNGS